MRYVVNEYLPAMRSGTICCMSDFNAKDKGVSPSESRRFKLTVGKPLLGSAIIVSKFKLQTHITRRYKLKIKIYYSKDSL